MDKEAAQKDVTDLAMKALRRAIESWETAGDELMMVLLLRESSELQWSRVDMETPADSLAVARNSVIEATGKVDGYAFAFLGYVEGDRHAFKFGAIASAKETLRSGGQPALVVEAGNAWVDPDGALAMAVLIKNDDQGIFLESRPSHFKGSANWLRADELRAMRT